MSIRRRLLIQQHSQELYPIGTDILTRYIGVDASSLLLLTRYTTFNVNTGEIVSGSNATSEVYIPVSTNYTYEKGARRIRVYFYDNNKEYLGNNGVTTWLPQVQVLPAFPANTAFMRCEFLGNGGQNWMPSYGAYITRIA